MKKNPLIEKQKSAPAQSAIPVKKARSTLFFIVGVSIVLGITALIELLVGFILMRTKIFVVGPENQLFWIFIIFVVTSVSIGVFVSVIVSRFVLSPVDRLLEAMQKLYEIAVYSRADKIYGYRHYSGGKRHFNKRGDIRAHKQNLIALE